jgi:hypothetical protein
MTSATDTSVPALTYRGQLKHSTNPGVSLRDAMQFVEWRDDELEDMKERRTFYLRMYHAAIRFIRTHGLFDERAWRMADACVKYEGQYFELDQQIEAFAQMSVEDQAALWRRQKRADAMQWDGASTCA